MTAFERVIRFAQTIKVGRIDGGQDASGRSWLDKSGASDTKHFPAF